MTGPADPNDDPTRQFQPPPSPWANERPFQQAPPPPGRSWVARHKVLTAVLAVVGVFVVLGGIGAALAPAGDDGKKKPVAAATSTAGRTTSAPAGDTADGVQETTPPPPAVEADYTPTVKDFTVTLKIKTKECFGDYGCNVTYEPKLTIVGPNVDEDGSYEITYEVRGGKDGAAIDTLEVDGGQYTATDGLVTTPRQSSKLTAVITEVEVS